MPLLPEGSSAEDREWASDIATGRRAELDLSNEFVATLQYFPEWGTVTFSFYSKTLPGFTICVPTADWKRYQEFVASFNWEGRKQ